MTTEKKADENKNGQLLFPDINKVLCPKETIPLKDAINNYRKMLLDSDLHYNTLYANKLLEHQEMMLPKNLISSKRDISQLQKHIASWARKHNYKFPIIIIKRKKGDRKFHDKIRLFLTDMFVYEKDITLDSILDMMGIRIILCLGNDDTLDHIKLCRDVLIETINFFTGIKGYNPHKAEPKLFLGFDSKEHPEVIVAPKDFIPSEYQIYVKDYYSEPKKNSYQSYHIVFKTKCGLPLEVQIRTSATNFRVEHIKAKHEDHDKDKYPDPIILDRKNINIFGYNYSQDGDIVDFIGLDNAIDPFNMLYY